MGIVERKEREKQMRREMILQASESVFFEKGLRATTLDEIAERAEVSKGTIYLYYSSKEDLYYSLMIRGLLLLLRMVEDVKPEDLSPVEALYQFGKAYYKFSQEQTYLFKMLAIVESPVLNEQVSKEIISELERTSDKVLSYVAGFVQKGKDTGGFRSDVSAREAVIMLWVSLSGVLNLREHSMVMMKNNCLNKESILGSVDFDTLYWKYQNYLIDFLTRNVTPEASRRRATRKAQGALKNSKAVIKK